MFRWNWPLHSTQHSCCQVIWIGAGHKHTKKTNGVQAVYKISLFYCFLYKLALLLEKVMVALIVLAKLRYDLTSKYINLGSGDLISGIARKSADWERGKKNAGYIYFICCLSPSCICQNLRPFFFLSSKQKRKKDTLSQVIKRYDVITREFTRESRGQTTCYFGWLVSSRLLSFVGSHGTVAGDYCDKRGHWDDSVFPGLVAKYCENS